MSSGDRRSDDELREGIEAWARSRYDTHVVATARPSAGYSNETVVVELGSGVRRVLRLPPVTGIFPTYDLAAQVAVTDAVRAGGGVAPESTLETDTAFLGAPFVVMPFVDGHVGGEVVILDEWITGRSPEQQEMLHRAFVAALAGLHAMPAPDLDVRRCDRTLEPELGWWEQYVDWVFGADVPGAIASALRWCRDHAPADIPAASLLWGDVRIGNVVFGDDGSVRALLDWEMASIGPAELDVGWYLALEGLTEHFSGTRVPGFYDHDAFVAAYASALGRAVYDLEWYETFALVRSTAILAKTMLLDGRSLAAVVANPILDLLAARAAS